MLVNYNGFASRGAATVRVLIHGTLDLADLYADQNGDTVLGNPFTADVVTGAFTFWADDANVLDLQIDTGNTTPLVNLATLGEQRMVAELTNAQICALPTTPFVFSAVVPPTGYRLKPKGLSWVSYFADGAYGNVDPDYCDLTLTLPGQPLSVIYPLLVNDSTTDPVLAQISNTFGVATNQLVDMHPQSIVSVGLKQGADPIARADIPTGGGYVVNNDPVFGGGDPADWDGQPFILAMDNNGMGDLTGGALTNRLKISIYYNIEQL